MADIIPSSSQETFCKENRDPLDIDHISSSPPRLESRASSVVGSQKIKKPPTVTPKRFTRFFTPRNSLSTRAGRQGQAGRQLKDITQNGVNRRRSGQSWEDLGPNDEEHNTASRPLKRRKVSVQLDSSPPQSSPLKHVQTAQHFDPLETPSSPTFSDADTLPDLLADLKPFPKPIKRLRTPGPSRRVLERSFGGFDALSQGRRGLDHGADMRSQTANFVTSPADLHTFRPTALPFCATSCNTNPLVAIGDEEGSVRLIDSSSSSNFSQAHVRFRVHHNAVMDIAFSSDDYMLATSSGDQTARVVDMQTQQTMCILSGHKSSVKQVRFRPGDDNMVTTSSRDGTIQLWDLRCGSKSAVQNFRASFGRQAGSTQPQARYGQRLDVGYGHRSNHRPYEADARNELSITSFFHLPNGREHLIVTSSEVDASVKLWDIRNAGRRMNASPLSSTPLPEPHRSVRNYGINSMTMSGDGARLYTLCRDATVYAYSTNSLVLGSAPELSSSLSRRRNLNKPKSGLGPLYGFKHPSLKLSTFYIKMSLRPAQGDRGEMLAVGSTEKCAILFSTDERFHPSRPKATVDDSEDSDHEDMPLPAPKFPIKKSTKSTPASSNLHVFEHGTALKEGHKKEVTSLAWSNEGNLISVSDDFTARCWREDAQKARELRQMGEVGGGRWRCGWAHVDAEWDEDDG